MTSSAVTRQDSDQWLLHLPFYERGHNLALEKVSRLKSVQHPIVDNHPQLHLCTHSLHITMYQDGDHPSSPPAYAREHPDEDSRSEYAQELLPQPRHDKKERKQDNQRYDDTDNYDNTSNNGNPDSSTPAPSYLENLHARSERRSWVSDTWLWEFLALGISTGCLIAIAMVLKQHDQKPIPTFFWGLTLNAIVAILSTFSKSALIVAVSAGLGQLKWHWLSTVTRETDNQLNEQQRSRQGRVLLDTDLFDNASRGP